MSCIQLGKLFLHEIEKTLSKIRPVRSRFFFTPSRKNVSHSITLATYVINEAQMR